MSSLKIIQFGKSGALLCSLFAISAAVGQEAGVGDGFDTRPDVFIQVRKSGIGPDYVWIKTLAEDYPQELLAKQCEAVGEHLGNPIRGLELSYTPTGTSPGGTEGRILNARFAADGLIGQTPGALLLLPFARAFASSPEPYQVNVLMISFVGERPQSGVTLQSHDGPSASVSAYYDETVPQIEYRIVLKTQNRDEIEIPISFEAQTNPPEKPSTNGMPTKLIGLVVGGSALAGLLVYFALRPYRRARSASESERAR